MKIFALLPWGDWLAILWFFSGWIGYAWFARHYGAQQPSLLQTTNRYRHYWLLQATARDPRVIDGIITQNLSSTPAFFSSTTIIISRLRDEPADLLGDVAGPEVLELLQPGEDGVLREETSRPLRPPGTASSSRRFTGQAGVRRMCLSRHPAA